MSEGRVSVIVLLREDGAALLQHRDDKPSIRRPGVWVMPGGHQDPHETAEMCARREFREETAYDCADFNWLATFVDPEQPDCLCTMYWARFDGQQVIRCLEGQDLRFVLRQDAAGYAVPAFLVELWDQALAALAKMDVGQ